jgi:signal transduction histidine kinase
VQDRDAEPSFVVYAPVYENGRRKGAALTGYVSAVYRVRELVDLSLPTLQASALQLELTDGDDTLYGAVRSVPGLGWLETKRTIDVGGRLWVARFAPTHAYVQQHSGWAPWGVLTAGLLFGALFTAFLLILTGRTARVEALVERRTTELGGANERLRRLVTDLERSNSDLEQFAYVASHDLKEPLRMVASYTQLLQKRYGGKLDEQADRYIEHAVTGAMRMHALIDDLLAYARASRGTQRTELVSMGEIVTRATANLDTALTESAGRVLHDALPVIHADPVKMVQVFQNLIGNALKFRSDATPEVRIRVDEDEKEWTVSIEDNGIGIAPEHAERVFRLFQRLHTKEEYEGTGIGLSIAKKIVERHGGRIWIGRSKRQRGSVCFFTLAKPTTVRLAA